MIFQSQGRKAAPGGKDEDGDNVSENRGSNRKRWVQIRISHEHPKT